MPDPKFCPICSHVLVLREAGGRERPSCDNCGYVHYVNPVPGVGLIIEMDGGVVLIQRWNPPHQDEWTLPSGFIEADESAEEAAIREAEEETGLKVEIIEMMGINSFPEGPPVSGIMIFYRARPIGGTLQAGDDAKQVKVVQPRDIPILPFRTHREIMAEWLEKYHEGILSAVNQTAPKPDFQIRPFEVDDADEVVALLAMIPANRHLEDEDWRAVMQRLQEAPLVEVFVAQTTQLPEMIIGCVSLSILRTLTEGRGFINDMAVLPAYQRRGIGVELLETVMRRANALNLSQIMVNVQRGNDQARAFYAASGVSKEEMMVLKIRS